MKPKALVFNGTPYVLTTFKLCQGNHSGLFDIHQSLDDLLVGMTSAGLIEDDLVRKIFLLLSTWRKYIEAIFTFIISIIKGHSKEKDLSPDEDGDYDELGNDIDYSSIERTSKPDVRVPFPKDQIPKLIAIFTKKNDNASTRKTSS